MTKTHTLPCNEQDRVIIRIWTSKLNKTTSGMGNVGHISIEIENPYDNATKYMSLWPNSPGHENITKAVTEKRTAHYMASYIEDYVAENMQPAQVVVCLYKLNTTAIIDKFLALKAKTKHWTLLGNNTFLGNSDAHSCASLAYKLLREGGIYQLASHTYSSENSSSVSPDRLVHLVKAAKREELISCPETQRFRYTRTHIIGHTSHTETETSAQVCTSFWRQPVVIGTIAASVIVASASLAYSQADTPNCKMM